MLKVLLYTMLASFLCKIYLTWVRVEVKNWDIKNQTTFHVEGHGQHSVKEEEKKEKKLNLHSFTLHEPACLALTTKPSPSISLDAGLSLRLSD